MLRELAGEFGANAENITSRYIYCPGRVIGVEHNQHRFLIVLTCIGDDAILRVDYFISASA